MRIQSDYSTLDPDIPAAALHRGDAHPRIMIIDADAEYRRSTLGFLSDHGFDVREAADFGSALELLALHHFDIVILDVKNSTEDGLAVTRRLSAYSELCVIIVSELGSEVDRIVGLEAGADDYLTKPASSHELLARIRAVRRRTTQQTLGEHVHSNHYMFNGWSFETARCQLRDPDGSVVILSSGEASLLRAFLERPLRVLNRDQLLEFARGSNSEAFDRAIDTQISRLRRKLAASGGAYLVRTVRNEGYIFTSKVMTR